MIFSEQYQKAIFDSVRANRWDIYNAENPKLLASGLMYECLIKTPKLDCDTPYQLFPRRDLFKDDKLEAKGLDQKVLDLAEKVKPIITFYLKDEELKSFVLDKDKIRVKIELSESKVQFVSYQHFVGMLEKVKRPDMDLFV